MANTAGNTNWQALGAGGMWGGATSYGGGGFVVGHSELDQIRIGQGQVPGAQYPDGYLGTIRSRRDDRLLNSLKSRENQRAYQRGVHKGERIDQSDYFWPKALDPMRGLRNEARGKKTAPRMDLAPHPHLTNDGKTNLTFNGNAEINPKRVAQLRHLRPAWV